MSSLSQMRKPVGWEDSPRQQELQFPFWGDSWSSRWHRQKLPWSQQQSLPPIQMLHNHKQTKSPPPPSLPPSTLSIFCQLPPYSTPLGWLPVFVENDMALPQRPCSPRTCLRLWASHQMYASLWAVLSKAGRHFFKKEQVDTRVLGTPLLLIVIANSYCILMLHAVLT